MKVNKILSDQLEACYSVSRIKDDKHDYLLIASEVEQGCFAYDMNNQLAKTVVWDTVGGTMSIVQIPGTLDFLATQKFYPGFNSAACQIVHGKFDNGQWTITKLVDFPYLHRFDLIEQSDGNILFVGCTIANSKAFVEDWSDNGKIFVGTFDKDKVQLNDVRALALRLLKNHGYYAVKSEGYSLITAVEGIFKLTYPEHADTGEWRLDMIFNEETSDIVQIDLNKDGHKENMLIQGFHGDQFKIFNHDFSELLYQHPTPTEFGHALWSGDLLGRPLCCFGWRARQADLVVLTMLDGKVNIEMIEEQATSSNVLAFNKDDKAYIFSANNGKGEVALYELTN